MNEKEIKLHNLILEGNEKEAIELLKSDETIDVNFEYKQRSPIFSAVYEKMYDLFKIIVNRPNFNGNVEDGFGESLLQTLMYICFADELKEPNMNEVKKMVTNMVEDLLKLNSIDFSYQDINSDTALHVACDYLEGAWITEALIAKEDVNINAINDLDETPLATAIKRNNTEAIKLLSKRKDLIVRDVDVKKAEMNNIDLTEYGIDIKELKDTKTVNVNLRTKVLVESK